MEDNIEVRAVQESIALLGVLTGQLFFYDFYDTILTYVKSL